MDAKAVYLESTISGIIPIESPSITINKPPMTAPDLKRIIAIPIKTTAIIFPQEPFNEALTSVYQEAISLPPVPAKTLVTRP